MSMLDGTGDPHLEMATHQSCDLDNATTPTANVEYSTFTLENCHMQKNMSHVFEKIIWYDMIWLNIIWYNYIDILMIWDFDSKELPALGFLTASWMQRVGSWDLNMGAGPRRLELTMLCKYQLPAEPRFKLLNSWKRQSVKSSALKLAHICWR